MEIIKQAEAAEVTVIETKIQNLEEQEKKEAEAEDTRSIKEKFTTAVVMGDSITAGFTEYDILNASSVVAEIGAGLGGLEEQIGKLKELNPQVVFLSYGMNDILSTQGDTDAFIDQYKSIIKQMQKELPNTKIFINSIFPVSRQERERETYFRNWMPIMKRCGKCATGSRSRMWTTRSWCLTDTMKRTESILNQIFTRFGQNVWRRWLPYDREIRSELPGKCRTKL